MTHIPDQNYHPFFNSGQQVIHPVVVPHPLTPHYFLYHFPRATEVFKSYKGDSMHPLLRAQARKIQAYNNNIKPVEAVNETVRRPSVALSEGTESTFEAEVLTPKSGEINRFHPSTSREVVPVDSTPLHDPESERTHVKDHKELFDFPFKTVTHGQVDRLENHGMANAREVLRSKTVLSDSDVHHYASEEKQPKVLSDPLPMPDTRPLKQQLFERAPSYHVPRGSITMRSPVKDFIGGEIPHPLS